LGGFGGQCPPYGRVRQVLVALSTKTHDWTMAFLKDKTHAIEMKKTTTHEPSRVGIAHQI